MRFDAVTTCNLAGWKRYGHRMVESFNRLWANDVSLSVYSEDTLPIETCVFPEWLTQFKNRHSNNPDAHGKANGAYNYTRDCVRFAHKVAAVTDVALSSDADVLIWLDADTLTHAPVTQEWLESLIEKDAYIAWLDRAGLYPECGFYALNLKHPMHPEIMRDWVSLYLSDAVFLFPQTHDCVSLERVIRVAEADGDIKVQSLSGEQGRKHPHPFVNSRLAEKLDHLKGPRKDKGRSHKSDLIGGRRPEAHWQ